MYRKSEIFHQNSGKASKFRIAYEPKWQNVCFLQTLHTQREVDKSIWVLSFSFSILTISNAALLQTGGEKLLIFFFFFNETSSLALCGLNIFQENFE